MNKEPRLARAKPKARAQKILMNVSLECGVGNKNIDFFHNVILLHSNSFSLEVSERRTSRWPGHSQCMPNLRHVPLVAIEFFFGSLNPNGDRTPHRSRTSQSAGENLCHCDFALTKHLDYGSPQRRMNS
jgi:hypothetical protein